MSDEIKVKDDSMQKKIPLSKKSCEAGKQIM